MIRIYEIEFEDIKGVIRIRISKKNRQHNVQKKKYKRTNNDLQNIQQIKWLNQLPVVHVIIQILFINIDKIKRNKKSR